MKKLLILLLCLPEFGMGQYVVDVKKVKYPVQQNMWGLFFEDINRSTDGGIYAELIKNRSFDFPEAWMGWQSYPALSRYAERDIFQIVNQVKTNPNNPKYLQVTINKPGKFWIANEGFAGVTVEKGKAYTLSVLYRVKQPGIEVRAAVMNAANKIIGEVGLQPATGDAKEWKEVETTITTTDSVRKGFLHLSFEGKGQIDIDRISLFPTNTWQNENGGLRKDLVQLLYDIRPGFMRFPGGCIVEGQNIDNRYQWKQTIGALEDRKLNFNNWNNAIPTRPQPDYYQSYGVGFFEYFKLCEQLSADPMPIINTGLSCQFGAGEVVPADGMDEYVQDALDLIEFANGGVETKWGARRVAMGHFDPYNMTMLGVGNENWGPQYLERLNLFTKAIKAKYPYMKIICATGYSPNPQFGYMDSSLRAMNVDIIDEHYYQKVNWFLMNSKKYDSYDRKGPKIFLGEYACHSVRIGSTDNKNTLLCALAEAAFMTGLERNADIVTMAAYAPLFAHVKEWQWTPNLIWFDNSSAYATPSYWVQQLYGTNKGTDVVPISLKNEVVGGQDSVWANAVVDRNSKEVILKLVNPSSSSKVKTISLAGLSKTGGKATITLLSGEDLQAENSIERPSLIKPVTSEIRLKGKDVVVELPKYSFVVIRTKM